MRNIPKWLWGLVGFSRYGVPKPAAKPGRTIDMTWRAWGHNITFLSQDAETGIHSISGWHRPLPSVGDIILSKFSGDDGPYVGRLKVLTVEYCGDPDDMFFATVGNIGAREGPIPAQRYGWV